MFKVYQEKSHESSDYKKQSQIKSDREHGSCHDGPLSRAPWALIIRGERFPVILWLPDELCMQKQYAYTVVPRKRTFRTLHFKMLYALQNNISNLLLKLYIKYENFFIKDLGYAKQYTLTLPFKSLGSGIFSYLIHLFSKDGLNGSKIFHSNRCCPWTLFSSKNLKKNKMVSTKILHFQ